METLDKISRYMEMTRSSVLENSQIITRVAADLYMIPTC